MKNLTICAFAVLALSACDVFKKSPTEPTTPANPNAVVYTAIGASDAIGYGSSAVCVPFVECPNGNGYVQIIGRRLKSDGRTVTLLNLGIPGAVLSPETQALGNQLGLDPIGNFLEREAPFVQRDATVVTVFAGGNDVRTVATAVDRGLVGSDVDGYINTQVQKFSRDMQSLVAAIKARAASARIVVLNLPNFAGIPYTNGYTLAQKRGIQQISVGMSAQINALTSKGAIVIDLMCDAAFYTASAYFEDGFHPNDAGYQHLADVMYAAVSTGAAAAPRASCSQMSLY